MSITPLSPIDDKENSTPIIPFWRQVTPAEVEVAIQGSFLQTIYNVLAKNYKPVAPCALILPQAILLTSLALTHKAEKEKTELPTLLDDDDPFPAHRSQVYIDTGFGNVPNVYILLVAPSAAGKGISLSMLSESIGYSELNCVSLEGMKDAAVRNPHILISIPEFGSCLQGRGYKDEFKKGVTALFNEGRFNDAYSVRKSDVSRKVDWFYPSLCAAIQPNVLAHMARQLDVEQGLFPRFLVSYLGEDDVNYDINTCNEDLMNDIYRIKTGLQIIARMKGVVQVPNSHYNTDFYHPIREVIDHSMHAVLMRYANEYLPRIALMLALPATPRQNEPLPNLTQDHLDRASVVLHFFLSMSERAFCPLSDLEGNQRNQEEDLKKMVRLIDRMTRNHDSNITLANISRSSSKTGWNSKSRIALLDELLQRNWINVRIPRGGAAEKLKKGDKIMLLRSNLPPGIL